MASQILGPRKKRTRQHVVADLSVHHVEGFILEEGHTAQRIVSDYGYDLVMFTYAEHGYIEPGLVYFQLKAKETIEENSSDCVYDLDIRDYNLWVREKQPVILVLFDASRKHANWLCVQSYFGEDTSRQPKKGTKTVRVRISNRQPINHQGIAKIRDLNRRLISERMDRNHETYRC